VPASTLLVIPAYREAGRVGDVVREVLALRAPASERLDLDVVVIDDGSGDGTAEEARAAGALVVQHPFNLGYGSALHTGYCFARRHGYRRVLQMDADGQHEAAMLPRLVEALERGADVALGSRYLDGTPPPTSLLRRLGTRLLAMIGTRWTGVRITDPTSGFQGLSARAVAAIANDGFPEDYPDTDVLVLHARAGMRIAEVPVRMHERRGGMSMHRGARIAYYAYKMLLTLLLLPVRRPTPFRSHDTVARAS
jgi:glycosyltransferase involved in cell wall biosynthesis